MRYGINGSEEKATMLDSLLNGEAKVNNGSGTIRFGAFEADLHTGEVRKSGSRIKLQDQPFKVLQILLEHPGVIITREELQTRIWPEETYGDFDHAVNVAVGKLRTALGDSAENPCFIETVPRRGYRFVARLENTPVEEVPPPVLTPATTPPPPPERKPRHTLRFVALIVALSTILLGVGVWLGRRMAAPRILDFQRLTVRHGTVYSARFAPDGHNVIYTASWDGAPVEVFSTDLKIPGERSVGIPSSQLLAVSSTGQMAVLESPRYAFMFTMRGILAQVPITGGSPRQIAEDVEGADWSPDGKALAIVRQVGERQRLEYPVGHVLYETDGWINHPRISPKDGQIAFLDHPTRDDDQGMVSVIDFAGHKKVLSTGWESEEGLAWSPDGSEVWFSAALTGLQRRIYAVDLSGRIRPAFRAPAGVILQDIAPDGRLLLTRDEQRAGVMGMAEGATRERDLSWLDWSLPVDISRDGKTVLLDEQGEQSGPTYTVAIRDMQGSPPIPLGEGMAGDFSPDGKWVVTAVSYTQLLLLPTGAGTVKRIDRGGIQHYLHEIHWMPDGKQIVFAGSMAGHPIRCFIQNVDGGPPRPITPEGVSWCHVSPDGQSIAAGDTDGFKLYPLDGSAPRAFAGLLPGETFSWTTDPQFVYAYQEHKPTLAPLKVYRVNIVSGQRQIFKEIAPLDETGLCGMMRVIFSANGRAYVYGYVRQLSELYLVNGVT
jgi:DNA-binding winged helix-turn-helix (wHTH) protein/Tol biopolymer transport system component